MAIKGGWFTFLDSPSFFRRHRKKHITVFPTFYVFMHVCRDYVFAVIWLPLGVTLLRISLSPFSSHGNFTDWLSRPPKIKSLVCWRCEPITFLVDDVCILVIYYRVTC